MITFFRTCSAMIVLIIALAPCVLHAGPAEARLSLTSFMLEDSLKSSLPVNARWSFSAVDFTTGREVAKADNAGGASLAPGSLVKLITTAAVLESSHNGKITMDTIIATDGTIAKNRLQGNLYLKGAGNPLLSEEDLEKAIERLHVRGIREIAGDIICDDSLFDARGWKARWAGPAYTSPGALGLNLHTVSVTSIGTVPRVILSPRNEAVKISINPAGERKIRQIDDVTYEVSGASDGAVIKKRFSLKDPGLYAAGTMKTLLQERGIAIKGTVKRGIAPAGATELDRIQPRSLAEMIKDTNYNSLNVVAENLLLLLGAKKYGAPGTFEKGTNAEKEFLRDLGLLTDNITLADGSGLSTDNRLTSEFMARFLQKIVTRPWFTVFFESLPRVGMDGTLKSIGYRNEQVRAKAGLLNDAYCLAGYVERSSGQKIAFAYLMNGAGADVMGTVYDVGALVMKQLSEDSAIVNH